MKNDRAQSVDGMCWQASFLATDEHGSNTDGKGFSAVAQFGKKRSHPERSGGFAERSRNPALGEADGPWRQISRFFSGEIVEVLRLRKASATKKPRCWRCVLYG